jgi:hypothetical protein
MALEALVNLNIGKADGLNRAGDILVLAVAGHPWSDLERKQFLVVDYKEADAATLEAKVIEAGGVMAYPFAVTVDGPPLIEGGAPTKQMVNVCSKVVDLTLVPDKDKVVDQPREKITTPVIAPRIEKAR